ncbi:MAG: ribonuclease P protein component [Bacilli bacterium]|nr:ribonuclease P protein component [Bacilli bacterium]
MKKINILKKNEDFNRIIASIKPYKYKDYIIYKEKHNFGISHFGISVGKKVGNAVTRNHIKRQLKNIIDQIPYKNNFNCIIIVRKGIIGKSFLEMKNDLTEAMKQVHILEENE